MRNSTFDSSIIDVTVSNCCSSDDSGNYQCRSCGTRWKAGPRFLWWPIRLAWRRGSRHSRLFDMHGWQVGWDGIEQPVFGRTLHIGALKVIFGRTNERACADVSPPQEPHD